VKTKAPDCIKFLGTAGARFVVLKQLRSSAGTFISINGRGIILDPGPGTLVRCAASRPKIEGKDIDAVILTHTHIDHSTDVNVMIELMTDGGFTRRGVLFATEEALSGEDPVILKYVRQFPERIEILKPDTEYTIGESAVCMLSSPASGRGPKRRAEPPDANPAKESSLPAAVCRFRTHGKHQHPVETYGLTFSSQEGPVSFVVDTSFFPKLCEWYAGSAVLVVNMVRMTPHEKDTVMHLNYDDARTLISSIRPRFAIITHFGMTVIKAKPWEVAKRLSDETRVEVIAAADGKTVELARREANEEQANLFR